ncbi:MAG: sigma-54-dependent Fis family transcriptional regulator [Burkholderiales bacterium]|nr:sigma-54-dependent Fis family transcriptional regulator [Burkholderiales bacterium]MDE2628840.1 sigma-54-dependent Fis family transcriptional regulator [Burkholderiales bacterium]
MQLRQSNHIRAVMQVAGEGRIPASESDRDAVIRESWSRCVHQHHLDPTRMCEPLILPSHQVREHQQRIEDLLHIARHGLETLYQQVAGMGYCLLLTDARGVTVDFIGDIALDTSLRRAGLYLGADWSEERAGTCGVGTAIATGEALTVHLDDHFDATHIPLTCTTSPVFDPQGQLTAVLDISALSSPQNKDSQHLALQLVKMYASLIENANFVQRYRRDWILRLNESPEFVDVNPRYLLALDAAGRVIGHNRAAQRLLQAEARAVPVLGQTFERLFDARLDELGRFVPFRSSDQRALTVAGSGRLLFMQATPPAPSGSAKEQQAAQAGRPLPAPLAALSGGDPALDRQIERAARLVNASVGILLCGETGSGKEMFAKALHEGSGRRGRRFVAVNCAAIPESLIESELFGHLPGSFSGAGSKGKRGLVQEADGGTLFLDEIGDMPRDMQTRLLRVLAEREVLPIGATRPVPVNLRVIAATHHDLQALVRQGAFRDDLYYRLNGAQINLPPLRERRDIDWVIQRLLDAGARADGQAATPQLSAAARARLHAHHWPGNLREMRNVLDFARAVCSGGCIDLEDLPDNLMASAQAAPAPVNRPASVWQSAGEHPPEAVLLLQYLRAAQWNVTAVARQLGLSRMTLYRRMHRFGIVSPNQQQDAGAAP